MACTFRPSKEAAKALESIKQRMGFKTNSKALEYVLKSHLVLENRLQETKVALNHSNQVLGSIKQVLANKADADTAYKDMIHKLIPN